MIKECARKLRSALIITSIFTILFLNSHAFASPSNLVEKGIIENYRFSSWWDFHKTFKIPKAVKYYNTKYDYSIIDETGVKELVEKVEGIISRLPDSLIPRGGEIAIVFHKTTGTEEYVLGACYKKQIYVKAEKLTGRELIHEIAHFKDFKDAKDGVAYGLSEEYIDAFNKDVKLKGEKNYEYVSRYARESVEEGKYYEQFAELISDLYLNLIWENDSEASKYYEYKYPLKAAKNNPYQTKYIVEKVLNGEYPNLPEGLECKSFLDEVIEYDLGNTANKIATDEKAPQSDGHAAISSIDNNDNNNSGNNISSDNISSYADDSTFSDKKYDDEKGDSLGSDEEDSTDDPESYYYIDEEGNRYYIDEEGYEYRIDALGNKYYIDEEGNKLYLEENS